MGILGPTPALRPGAAQQGPDQPQPGSNTSTSSVACAYVTNLNGGGLRAPPRAQAAAAARAVCGGRVLTLNPQ